MSATGSASEAAKGPQPVQQVTEAKGTQPGKHNKREEGDWTELVSHLLPYSGNLNIQVYFVRFMVSMAIMSSSLVGIIATLMAESGAEM